MKKRVLSLALALLLCVGLATPALAASNIGKVGEVQTISRGKNGYMAIDDQGTLWSWEYSNSNPVRVMENISSVAYGSTAVNSFTMVIKTDGTLWAWGTNRYGELGQGTRSEEYSNTPVKVLDDVAAVSTGGNYTMAIKTDGTLWAWGNDEYGKLGKGSQGDDSIPVKIMDDVAAVSAAAGGTGWTTLAVKTDGTLWAWGWNGTAKTTGALGFYGGNVYLNDVYYQTVPRQVYGIDHVVAISNGGNRFMALKDDGTLWSWGMGSYGATPYEVYLGYRETNKTYSLSGNDTCYEQTTPKQVTDQVSAAWFGDSYAMAIKTDGTLWAWGDNGYQDRKINRLGFTGGDVFISDRWSPLYGAYWQSVPRKVEQISDVAEGSGELIRKSDGTLWQLIDGSFVPIELSDFIVSESGRLEAYIGLGGDVVIPDKVTVIGGDVFSGNTDLTGVTIPNSVTAIEANAFSGCTGLTGVTIPSGVTRIGSGAFSGCTGLTDVTIPNSVTAIEANVFSGCTSLTSVTIPSGVTRIGSGAFSGCTGLTGVTIPDSVTKIDPDAFADCVSLINVTAPKKNGVTDGVFDQTPYQEKENARHTMMVTILAASAVAAVILVVILNVLKRKKDPEGYARKKQEQERRREEKRAEQAAAEEARNAKLAAEEEARREKQAAEEKVKREQQAAAQAKRRIEAVLSGTVTCSCGAVNPATAQFCAQCGKPIKVPGRCVCGHQNDPEARFCQKCGKPLDDGEGSHEA